MILAAQGSLFQTGRATLSPLRYAAIMRIRQAAVLLLIGLTCDPPPGLADAPHAGLAEVNVLPKYEMWIPDPEVSELRPDAVTPHTPWARRYAGRGMKLVVIAPRWTQRATVELQQRFAFDAVPVMTFFHHRWADTDGPHYGWIRFGTASYMTERALAALRSAYRPDVIVLGWLDGTIVPAEVEEAIHDAVAAGSGLVVINPKRLSKSIEALIGRCARVPDEKLRPIVDGIPMRLLPPMPAMAPRDFLGRGARFHAMEGGGRVAVVDYAPLSMTRSTNCWLSPPGATESGKGIRDIHYDYYCSLVGRVVLWAGDNMPIVRLGAWGGLASTVDTSAGSARLGALRVISHGVPLPDAAAELVVRDLEGIVEHRASITIADEHIVLDVPALPEGDHYADVILRDRNGLTLEWGTAHFTSTSGARVTSLAADGPSFRPEQPLPIRVALGGELTNSTLKVSVFDLHDRQVWKRAIEARATVEGPIALTADVRHVATVQCRVVATLRRGDVVLSRRTIHVPIVQAPPPPDQFQYGAWASINASFVRRQTARILADHGVRTGILGGDMADWGRLNVMAGPYITRHISSNDTSAKGLIVRKPCLTDPQFLEAEWKKLREKTEQFRHHSPIAYSLGDDQGMMREPLDGCVSPTCLEHFRAYLADQYGSVEALNASWGTHYAGFDEAAPLSLPEALKTRAYPRWADHRLYMDRLFVEIHRDSRRLIRGIDPGARVGFEGPLAENSWIGFEWKQLLDVVDQMAPYPNGWKWDIIRSFAKPNLLFGGWSGAYPMYRYPDDRRSYPWFMLFQGANIYYFFSTYGWSEAGDQSMGLAPDLRVLPNLAEATANINRIQQGIDRLVLGAERVTDDVAILFSRQSQHATMVSPRIPIRDFDISAGWTAYIATHDHNWALNTEAMLRLLDDMGLSYVFVDHTDVAAGALTRRGFRMLVMPMSHAISGETADAIRQFVEAGGSMLADFKPAAFDAHVKPMERGHLDNVFGFERRGAPTQGLRDEMVTLADLSKHEIGAIDDEKDEHDTWTVPIDEILQFTAAGERRNDLGARVPLPVDASVTIAGGEAAVTSDEGTPVFITRRHGKGRACLMNMAPQHYLTLRCAGRGLGMQVRMAEFLATAGVEPDIRAKAVGGHTARLRLFRFRDGDADLVGILRPHKRLLDEPEAFADRSPRPFRIEFGRKRHVYEVIGRTYHGHLDALEIKVPVATPMLLAALPYKVDAIDAEARQENGRVTVTADVKADAAGIGRHVIIVRVTDGEGRRRPEYGLDVIADGGRGVHAFNLALDDPSGTWTFDLEDVATGTRRALTFDIAAP